MNKMIQNLQLIRNQAQLKEMGSPLKQYLERID